MAYESVDIYVQEADSTPIESVLVRVFSEDGSTFFTEATTDATGLAGFTLYTQKYSLRFYKNRVSFSQPQVIEVIESATNSFDVTGTVLTLPQATNPRLCRCSGYFKDLSGAPRRFLDIQFRTEFSPLLLEGDAVVTEVVRAKTDEDGWASIDLIRNGIYRVTIEAMEDCLRRITVPDLSSCNLPDLLFQVVESVTLTPEGPYALAVDETLEITPVVLTSAGVELEGAASTDVRWSTGDASVASVEASGDILTLRGVATGSTTLEAVRQDESIIRIPSPDITGQPVDITVT